MISINTQIESNYEISICPRCEAEHYSHVYNEYGCHCLSAKELEKLEKRKQQWKEMQTRAAEKQKLKREALKNNKEYLNKIKSSLNAKKQPIKKISDKQKEISAKLKELKEQISNEAKNQNQYYCHGCGITSKHLDRSHRLSVAQRPDLQLKKDNIVLLCRYCHMKHESGEMTQILELNCFVEDMQYIYEKDRTRFQKLFFKLLDHYAKNPTKEISKILKKIESFKYDI